METYVTRSETFFRWLAGDYKADRPEVGHWAHGEPRAIRQCEDYAGLSQGRRGCTHYSGMSSEDRKAPRGTPVCAVITQTVAIEL